MRRAEPLRIALFTYAVQPRGGVLHALALAEALQAAGHAVVLHALDDADSGFIRTPRCPTAIVRLDARDESFDAFVERRIDAYVAWFGAHGAAYDVYHAHDGISGNALATLAERGVIPGFVRTVHHLDDFGASAMSARQDRAVARASQWLVVSDLWRERLEARYGVAATVVPSGVDGSRFSPVDARARRRARATFIDTAGPLFAMIGGIERRKNTIAALEAFALLHASNSDARLVIAGGASVLDHSAYRDAFVARARALGLRIGAEVRVLGVLPDDAIVALLRAAHALVFPSLVEGFGLVLLEALACGTPVVASAIPPFTEFLGAGDALLTDPRDPAALAQAMRRACSRQITVRTRRRGPLLARRFSWERSARAHLAAYAAGTAERAVTHA